MELEEKTKTSVLKDLAETAFVSVFLVGWIVCCLATTFLLRTVGEKLVDENDAQSRGNNFRLYFRKILLRSRTWLVSVPEALGI
jgi:hypothetical protein